MMKECFHWFSFYIMVGGFVAFCVYYFLRPNKLIMIKFHGELKVHKNKISKEFRRCTSILNVSLESLNVERKSSK